MDLKCPFCGKDDIENRLALCVQCGASISYNVKKAEARGKNKNEVIQKAGSKMNLIIFAPIMFFFAFMAYLVSSSSESGGIHILAIVAAVPTFFIALILYLTRAPLMRWANKDVDKHISSSFDSDDDGPDIATFSRDGRQIDVELYEAL